MPSACFKCGDMQIAIETIMDCHRNMPKACPYVLLPSLPPKKTAQWINCTILILVDRFGCYP